jgi:hypothetical protein
MNFIFSSHPEHPWFPGWTFEPRDCSATFRQDNAPLFFRTTETVGRIVPNTDTPEWVFQIPVPQNSRTNVLFNGFCSYLTRKKQHYGGELLVPEPGVIWGRYIGIPDPEIASDQPIEKSGDTLWIASDTTPVLLVNHATSFCLVSKCQLKNDALELANHYLKQDFDAVLTEELEKRSGTTGLLAEMDHHDALTVIGTESMMKALRLPEGSIPLRWSQSPVVGTVETNVNELYPLVQAWKLIDIDVAEELVTCALKIQTNAGAIPVHYSPHTTHSTLEAPKPLVAKAVEEVWNIRKSDELLTTLLPPLRRHLQWQLHHFDPKRSGLHSWKNRTEPLVPKIYETDKATVDLTVLLLTEIEAYNRLKEQSSAFQNESINFDKERDVLVQNLQEIFWNEDAAAYCNALHREKIQKIGGFCAFMPLLWNEIPNRNRSAIMDRTRESGNLPGGANVLSWKQTALDDGEFPVLQQLLIFQALKTADPNGQTIHDYARVTLQGFVEWHSMLMNEGHTLNINPVMAAFILNVQAIRQYRYHAKDGASGILFKLLKKSKTDSFELIVVLTCILIIFCVRMFYISLNAPPPLDLLEAELKTAYINRSSGDVYQNSSLIIKYYPNDAAQARLMAANMSMLEGYFLDASKLYAQVREQHPDSPGPMIAQGLIYQLQGRFKEADQIYYEFCYIFEEIFPEIVEEVSRFRYLAQEGFREPPKWNNIYRYQIMHEL